jgi:hypothetical protein
MLTVIVGNACRPLQAIDKIVVVSQIGFQAGFIPSTTVGQNSETVGWIGTAQRSVS